MLYLAMTINYLTYLNLHYSLVYAKPGAQHQLTLRSEVNSRKKAKSNILTEIDNI